MEKVLILLIICLIILLIVVLITFAIILFKYLKNSTSFFPESYNKAKFSKEINQELGQLKEESSQAEVNKGFCIDHSELPAQGVCAISDEPYCELCLTKQDDIKVSRKNLSIYLDHEWKQLGIFLLSELGADKLNKLYVFKKKVWREQHKPMINQRQFKINVEHDRVEEYISLKVRVQDFELFESFLDETVR